MEYDSESEERAFFIDQIQMVVAKEKTHSDKIRELLQSICTITKTRIACLFWETAQDEYRLELFENSLSKEWTGIYVPDSFSLPTQSGPVRAFAENAKHVVVNFVEGMNDEFKHALISHLALKSACYVPIIGPQRDPRGLIGVFDDQVRPFSNHSIELMQITAAIINETDIRRSSDTSPQVLRETLKSNHKATVASLMLLSGQLILEAKNRSHRKPNSFASDREAEQYQKDTVFLTQISERISELTTNLADLDPVQDDTKAVERQIFSIRDEISQWLQTHQKDAFDVIARLPILAGAIATFSWVGVPPTASMIGAMTMFAPHQARVFLSDLIKSVKG